MSLSNIAMYQNISLHIQSTCPLPLLTEQGLDNRVNVLNPLSLLENPFTEEARNLQVIETASGLNGRVSLIEDEGSDWGDWGDMFAKLWNFLFEDSASLKDPNVCSLSDKYRELRLANPTSTPRLYTFNVTALERNTFAHSIPFSPYQHLHVVDNLQADERWLKEVDESIADSNRIRLQNEGISGSYLIKNKHGAPIAIFKPDDQVGGGKDNPKGKFGLASSSTVLGSAREYAARLIGGDFCSVPELHTVKVFLNGRLQLGSLQKYIVNDGDTEKLFSSGIKIIREICGVDPAKKIEDLTLEDLNRFTASMSDPKTLWSIAVKAHESTKAMLSKISGSVQRLAILDMLIQNSDRINPKNLLFKDLGDRYELIPIDHNLAFPEDIVPLNPGVVWAQHPAMKMPLEKESIDFVRGLDLDKISSEMLRLGMSPAQIGAFKLMGTLLKLGVEDNVSLYEFVVLLQPSSTHDLGIGLFQQLVVKEIRDILISNSELKIDQILASETLLKNVQEKLKPMFHQLRDDINRQGGSEVVALSKLIYDPEILSDYSAWKSMYDRLMGIMGGSKEPECYPKLKETEERYHLHGNGTCSV